MYGLFPFLSSPLPPCSIKEKETSAQTLASWFFGTLAHHLPGQQAFQIQSVTIPCPNKSSRFIGLPSREWGFPDGPSGKAWKHRSFGRVWLFVTPRTVAHQLLRPWNSSGKNTGVGSHSPSPGDLPYSPPAKSGVVRDEGSIPVFGEIPWSRKWQPGPVLLPGKFHGQRSLVDYSPWSCKESDTTEQLSALGGSSGRPVLVKFSGIKLMIIHCFSDTLLQNRHAISYSFQI